MSFRRAIAMLFALTLVAAACSDDDSGGGLASGDGFSIEAALAQIPLDEERGLTISVGDLGRANELAGLERPDADDEEALRDWSMLLTAGALDEQDTVFVPLAELLMSTSGPHAEVADELGWNLGDVETFVEVLRPPYRTLVVSGESLSGDVFDDGDLVELEEDILTAGEGDDLYVDIEARTTARPLGAPLRLAADGERIIVSSTTEVVRSWLDGELTSFADSEPHREVAAALDDADAYAAMFFNMDESDTSRPPLPDDLPRLTASFDVLALGWSVVDGEAVITAVHHFGDEETAEEQVENIEAILRDGTLFTGQPYADVLTLDDAVADGPLAITTLRMTDASHLRMPFDMVMQRDVLFSVS